MPRDAPDPSQSWHVSAGREKQADQLRRGLAVAPPTRDGAEADTVGNAQCLWQNLPAGQSLDPDRQPALQAVLNDRHSQVQR